MKANGLGPWSDQKTSKRRFRKDEVKKLKEMVAREQEHNPDGKIINPSIKDAVKRKRLENKKRREEHG